MMPTLAHDLARVRELAHDAARTAYNEAAVERVCRAAGDSDCQIDDGSENCRYENGGGNACLNHELQRAHHALRDARRRITELEAENGGLREALAEASEMSEELPELNHSNYSHDQVCLLDSRAVELTSHLRRAAKAIRKP